jgi:hypothetical protein
MGHSLTTAGNAGRVQADTVIVAQMGVQDIDTGAAQVAWQRMQVVDGILDTEVAIQAKLSGEIDASLGGLHFNRLVSICVLWRRRPAGKGHVVALRLKRLAHLYGWFGWAGPLPVTIKMQNLHALATALSQSLRRLDPIEARVRTQYFRLPAGSSPCLM